MAPDASLSSISIDGGGDTGDTGFEPQDTSSAIDTGGDSADGSLAIGDEPAEGGPEATPAADLDPNAAPTVTDSPAITEGRLSPAAKTALTELAKTQPKLAKSIKNALFEADALRRQIPGGVNEVKQMQERLEQFGGPEAIAKSHEELQYFNDLDSQFTAGDPRFIQAMIETPEGQQGFVKLAPAMLEKYKELAPEVHDSYVAKQQYQGMLDSDLKFSIVRIKDALDRLPDSPEKQAAMSQWEPLAVYYNNVMDKAMKKVEAPKFAPTREQQGPDEKAQFQQEKMQFERDRWTSEATGSAERLINSELTRIAAARGFNTQQKAALLELGVSRLQKALKTLPKFNETAGRFFSNKDKNGYMRHVNSAYQQHIPAVFKAAADSLQSKPSVNGTAVPKNGAAQPGQATPVNGQAPNGTARAAQGFQWVGAVPNKTLVDTVRTSSEMIRNGQAILLDGKRVQWRKM